jgi:predicted RNA polymerase sigma factor
LEVLTFFGVKAESNVVEIVPGRAGYWTEILAPYLKDRGHYTASGDAERDIAPLKARIAASPEFYGKTTITEFTGVDQEIAPPGSTDFVLTFRNIYNWMRAGTADSAFRAFYKALKPGGISREARAALALRMICGLTTEEIARPFLLPDATIAQRIVRAKRTLSESGLAYETPRGEELSERLSSVLEVVYLIFNEGYTAARGQDWLRRQLCNEALRMGRVLTSIAPHEPEAHGLLALMELNASRTAARTDAVGEPILMLDQNRALWDQLQIRRGMQALGQARELGGAAAFTPSRRQLSPATPRRGRRAIPTGRTSPDFMRSWRQLCARQSSNSTGAVAVGMAEGPEVGLAIVDRLMREPALKGYHLLPSVRGDLLHRLGRYEEARAAFEAAAARRATGANMTC